jgi:hypothetical protein
VILALTSVVMGTKKSVRDLETFQEIDSFNATNFEKNLLQPPNLYPVYVYKTRKPNLNGKSKSSKV